MRVRVGFALRDLSRADTRPVETPEGTIETNTITVNAPFLGLVPIPALLIDTVTIDFQMEVNSVEKSVSKTDASVEATASGGFFGAKFSVTGKVATSRENTRETNQTAKYQVNVNASQQPPTEGLAKLTDLFAACTAPIKME